MPSHGRAYYPAPDYRFHDADAAHSFAVTFRFVFEFRQAFDRACLTLAQRINEALQRGE